MHLWAYVPPPVAMFFTLLQFAKHSGNFLLPPCLKFASEYAPLGRPFRRLDDHYFSIPKRNRTFNPPHRSKQTGGVGPSGGTKGGTMGLGHYVGTVEGKTEKDAFVLA